MKTRKMQRMHVMARAIAVGCLMAVMAPSMAATDRCPGTVVNFSDQVSREVESDQLVAGLYIEKQARTPIALNQALNQVSQQASKAVAPFKPGVKVQTQNYDTWPVYDQKRERVIGWRGRLSLKVVGPLNEQTRRAIQALQQWMTLASLKPVVSAEKRKALRDELEVQLLKQAWTRLKRYGEALEASRVEMMEVRMNQTTAVRPVYREAMAMKMVAAEAPSTPVAVEGGQQKVSVSAGFRGCLLTGPVTGRVTGQP